MPPIKIELHDGSFIEVPGLTASDAERLVQIDSEELEPRQKVVRVLSAQIASPELSDDEVSDWDDDVLLECFRTWAASEDALDIALDVDSDFTAVASAIEAFVRDWENGLDKLISTPIVSLAHAVKGFDFTDLVDPIGLGRLAADMRSLESQIPSMLDRTLLGGMVEGLRAADYARKMEVPVFLGRQLANISPPIPSLWGGNTLTEQFEALRNIADSIDETYASAALSMSRTSLLAESTIARIDMSEWATFTQRLPVARALESAMRGHFSAFGELIDELGNVRPQLPPRLAYELPAIEVFNEADLAFKLAGDEEVVVADRRERRQEIRDGLDAELPELLADLKPSLARMWTGARQSLQGGNIDRARHVVASLRTLIDDVLNILAPEKELRALAGPEDLTNNGRVKRSFRFRYLGRNLEFDRLERAFGADVEALSKLYGVMNAIHDGEIAVRDDELAVLVVRVEGALRYAILVSRLTPSGA